MTGTRFSLATAGSLAAIALASGCAAFSSEELAVRSGCAAVATEHVTSGSLVVLDVSVTGCRAPDGRLLDHDEAVDRVARSVWESIELPVDALRVTVHEGATVNRSSAHLGRNTLDERFGPGPSGVVWPIEQDSPNDSIWLLLPVAHVVAGLALVAMARRLRDAGVIVLLLRR